jgi:hypothetical protein
MLTVGNVNVYLLPTNARTAFTKIYENFFLLSYLLNTLVPPMSFIAGFTSPAWIRTVPPPMRTIRRQA